MPPADSHRRAAAVAVLFLLIVLGDMWAPIARGQVYSAANLGQSWGLTANPDQPMLPMVRSQLDVYTELDPELAFEIRSIRAGKLPLWNPDNGNGQPFLADAVPATFSPFTVPFYVLSFAAALVVSAGLKLWCLAFFTFLWLRRLLHRDLPAVIGGVVFAFAGYQVILLNWQVMVGSVAALPFGLWCTQVALDWLGRDPPSPEPVRRRRVLRLCFAGGAVAVGTAVLGGHPETAVYVGVVLGIYLVAGGIYTLGLGARLVKWFAASVAAAVVGVALSAAVVAPFLQYESLSARNANAQITPGSRDVPFHPALVPMMAFPNLFGVSGDPNSDATFFTQYDTSYTEQNLTFTGLVALCLVPLGVAGLFTRRTRFVAGIAAGLALLDTFLLYTGFADKVWGHLPLLGQARVHRSQDLLLIGLAAMAAVGVDWLLAGPERGRFRDWRWRAGLLGVSTGLVSVVAVGGAWHVRRQIEGIEQASGAVEGVSSSLVHGQVAIQLACAVAAAGLLTLLLWRRASRVRFALAVSGGLVAVTCVSVMLPLGGWNPSVPKSLAYPNTVALASLRSVVGQDLTMYLGNSFPRAMASAWFDLEDVGSYDALGVAWHDYLLGEALGTIPLATGRPNPFLEQMPQCQEDLRLLGVQHVVGGKGVFGDGSRLAPHPVAVLPYRFYDVPGSGLVSVVGRSATVAGDASAMAEVTGCGFNADREVVLDTGKFNPNGISSPGTMTGGQLSGATAKVLARTSTSLTVETDERAPGWLVIRQTYFPGWQAQVDGRPAALERADVAFDAVKVPAGPHRVTLRYAPKTVSRGLDVSLAAVGVVLLVLLWAVFDWPVPGRRFSRDH